MKSIRLVSILTIIAIAAGWFLVKSLTVLIAVGEVGVRIQQYGVFGSKGVVQEDFGPGWHRKLGPIDTWEVYDSTIQTLEMTKDPQHGDRPERDDVNVRSSDGNNISLDVTVKFRIKEGQAHQVYEDTGRGTQYRTVVRSEAQRVCMAQFGRMHTEQFYDPHAMRATASDVKEELAEALERNFIEVVDVLVRDVTFDPAYEEKIRKKKLADQEAELNKSRTLAAEMEGKTKKIEAETQQLVKIVKEEKEAEIVRMKADTDLTIATITAEAEEYATKKKADADLVAAEQEAAGQLLIKTEEANGERLRNAAMMGSGGSTIVALEAARNLKLSSVTVSTMDIDLLDIDKMATKLGAAEAK